MADQQLSRAAPNPTLTGIRQETPPSSPNEDELPAKWPDRASHSPFQVEVQKVPVNSWMKEQFDKAVKGTASVYAMNKPVRGVFLLISNQNFQDARDKGKALQDRLGTEKDCTALKQLFEQLHFRVETYHDLSAAKMLAVFQDEVKDKVEATDNCFACAVLTHGERGKVCGVDGGTVTLDALKEAVADNYPMLTKKPKLFFIQACQGNKEDSGTPDMEGQDQSDAASNMSKMEKEMEELTDSFVGITLQDAGQPEAASKGKKSSSDQDTSQSDAPSMGKKSPKSDTFIAMATVSDFMSWRNTTSGTWFVQAIVYIFSRFAHESEINQLMTKVNRLVSRAETAKGFKQVSIYKSSLIRSFYFFPGLQHSGVPR